MPLAALYVRDGGGIWHRFASLELYKGHHTGKTRCGITLYNSAGPSSPLEGQARCRVCCAEMPSASP